MARLVVRDSLFPDRVTRRSNCSTTATPAVVTTTDVVLRRYPPDLQKAAVQNALQQAKALSAEWAA